MFSIQLKKGSTIWYYRPSWRGPKPPFQERLAYGRRSLKKNCIQWHRHTNKKTTDGHRNLETESSRGRYCEKCQIRRRLKKLFCLWFVLTSSSWMESNEKKRKISKKALSCIFCCCNQS